jgi:hypothetical protein
VLLLTRLATADKLIDASSPTAPSSAVIQTNLTRDREDELVRALQS